VGDGNNVARSLMSACVKTGMSFSMAAPAAYQLDPGLVESGWTVAARSGATIEMTDEPAEAVAGADIVYTDVWTSMGHEDEREAREKAFAGYQVKSALLEHAKPTAMVMHCLPAIRDAEISEELMESQRSLIYQQAENRLHSQRTLLEVLLGR
jgi:ornithine carbamoyltransferase